MTTRLALALAMLMAAPVDLPAQRKVDPRNRHHRLIAVVPLVGAGTRADPKRPQYAPWPATARKGGGILSYSQIVSDDGKSALVEFVATSRAAFAPILADRNPNVKAFEKGFAKKKDIERELKKYRKDFNLNQFAAVMR